MRRGALGWLKDLPAPLAGAPVRVDRISKVTGGLTVTLLENRGPYKFGEALHVKQYEYTETAPNGQ